MSERSSRPPEANDKALLAEYQQKEMTRKKVYSLIFFIISFHADYLISSKGQ